MNNMSAFPEGIDLLIYINLDTRTDRRMEIEKEFTRLLVPEDKVLRWPATRVAKNGALGCSMSHIAVLEHILTLPDSVQRIIVLEDDFDFSPDATMVKTSLQRFLDFPNESWDMALLSYEVLERRDFNDLVSIVSKSFGTSGYLIKRSCIASLLSNFRESRDGLSQPGDRRLFVLDVHWWKFMQNHKTFYFNIPLGEQRRSYSNITGLIVKRESVVKQK